ncbi:RNA polymerase sigma-70 factor [Sunxiuqinia sp. A32]|uniref:RNA polymerase sigma-70 factor n=1 Tax=Sunxiuqinia sp. A32 TaxID=3461496 RepID=UPI0040462A48
MQITQEIDDNKLAKLVNKGSKDAFAQLYNRYSGRINRFACGYLKSDHEAEELVQDVFLKIWNKRESLDGSQNVKAFIFKIAVNTIYDFIRRKNLELAFHEFTAGKSSASDETWDEVVYNDMLSQVRSLMAQMPEQRQKIFKLSREVGLTNDEIAEKLGLSKRTIENQLYRATAFLKKELTLDSGFAFLFFYLFC